MIYNNSYFKCYKPINGIIPNFVIFFCKSTIAASNDITLFVKEDPCADIVFAAIWLPKLSINLISMLIFVIYELYIY